MQRAQNTSDGLDTLLSEVTFVVVDLETTGGSHADSAITEIGAVKVRGGELLGEFQTLVDPQRPIPEFIQALTGITDEMVAAAPRLGEALPSFLEFARGAVLVAHNAPFDVGFLCAGADALGLDWPDPVVIDTVKLARRLVTAEEAPNRKLGTLAALFGARESPDHRALHDARATVDVFHALLERTGTLHVRTLNDLACFCSSVPAERRRKRHLAAGLPSSPGVYLFKDRQGQVLYIGMSQNVQARVRSYFTASESRSGMTTMISAAEEVTVVACETVLEARAHKLSPHRRASSGLQPAVETFPGAAFPDAVLSRRHDGRCHRREVSRSDHFPPLRRICGRGGDGATTSAVSDQLGLVAARPEASTTAFAITIGSIGCGTAESAYDHAASQSSWGRPVRTMVGGHSKNSCLNWRHMPSPPKGADSPSRISRSKEEERISLSAAAGVAHSVQDSISTPREGRFPTATRTASRVERSSL